MAEGADFTVPVVLITSRPFVFVLLGGPLHGSGQFGPGMFLSESSSAGNRDSGRFYIEEERAGMAVVWAAAGGGKQRERETEIEQKRGRQEESGRSSEPTERERERSVPRRDQEFCTRCANGKLMS